MSHGFSLFSLLFCEVSLSLIITKKYIFKKNLYSKRKSLCFTFYLFIFLYIYIFAFFLNKSNGFSFLFFYCSFCTRSDRQLSLVLKSDIHSFICIYRQVFMYISYIAMFICVFTHFSYKIILRMYLLTIFLRRVYFALLLHALLLLLLY